MTLTIEEINQLENYANEIPTRYGLPIINFLNQKREQIEVEKQSQEQDEQIDSELKE